MAVMFVGGGRRHTPRPAYARFAVLGLFGLGMALGLLGAGIQVWSLHFSLDARAAGGVFPALGAGLAAALFAGRGRAETVGPGVRVLFIVSGLGAALALGAASLAYEAALLPLPMLFLGGALGGFAWGAAALLEESGWAGVEMDMFVSTNVPDNAVPEIIQANLRDIGVNVTIVRQEIAEWVDFFLTGTFPGLYLAGTGFFWMAPETLPNMNFQFRFPENAVASVTGEYKRIVEDFAGQPTPAERAALFNDWNELWAEGPWLLPFHTINNPTIVNNRVQGATWPGQIFTFTEEWWLDA